MNLITTKTILELEIEIARADVRGDKHNFRKPANCEAQVSSMCRVNDNDLCIAICRFSQGVAVTSNKFTHNLLFLFPIVFETNFHIGQQNRRR